MIHAMNTGMNDFPAGTWRDLFDREKEKPYFEKLMAFIAEERRAHEVYPPADVVYHAFELTPFEDLRVVILGQDPYHGEGEAHGLCFSVREGIAIPPSLRNIFKEIKGETGSEPSSRGNLEGWARQGVLLLNATLTVRKDSPGSHQKKGWEEFTDMVIRKISAEKEHVVFLLWGRFAHAKADLIDASRHHILTAAHPSPLSARRGFFGCGHFAETNRILSAQGGAPINW